MRLLAGARLGRYVVTGPLGAGGMGEVYVARDERLGRNVAIKVLPESLTEDRERLERFELEARAASALNHPNVLSVFDIGTHEGAPYIVCELLEGETLRARLRRGPMPIGAAVDVMLQTSRALAAAHERGIIHRDLKPENLFITRDDRVKVLDFGLAKLIRPSGPLTDPASGSLDLTEPLDLTGTGVILGTAGYMAPEQVRGERVGTATDVFALGTVFYELFTGERAFAGATALESIAAVLMRDPPGIGTSRPDAPAPIVDIVSRCLNKIPGDRFDSASELIAHLEAALERPSSPFLLSSDERRPETVSRDARPRDALPISAPSPETSDSGLRPTTDLNLDATAVLDPGVASDRDTSNHDASNHDASRLASSASAATIASRVRRPVALLGLAAVATIALVAIVRFARDAVEPTNGAVATTPTPATTPNAAPDTPTFRRVTFRTGNVLSARFVPDEETIAYAAAWDGQTAEIFISAIEQPSPRPLGIRDASVLAVSTLGDVAISRHATPLRTAHRPGTLATVPLAGGPTREIATDVSGADFAPDGRTFAIVRETSAGSRLEWPPGTTLYESTGVLGMPRVSRDGASVAVVEVVGGILAIITIARDGSSTVLSAGWSSVFGLAWTGDGHELWFAASSTDGAGLWAVTPDGEQRLVLRLPGRLFLHDVSSSGRVLLDQGQVRAGVRVRVGDDEREVGWLDDSRLVDLTADGRFVLLSQRAGDPSVRGSFVRAVDGSPALKVADDLPSALSNDGRQTIVLPSTSTTFIALVPTQSDTAQADATQADTRQLSWGALHIERATFLPRASAGPGPRLLLTAAVDGGPLQLWVTDGDGDEPRAITPPGVVGREAIAANGEVVAVTGPTGALMLYAVDGSAERRCPGALAGEVPISFTNDGHGLRVYKPGEIPARVTLLSLTDGARVEDRRLGSSDDESLIAVFGVRVTPDGATAAYSYSRVLASDLYVVDGVR